MSQTRSAAASRPDVTAGATPNRWLLLAAAVLVQLGIGAVYAWSVFAKALQSPEAFGWSKAQTALPFTVVIGMVFVGSFLGGRLQDRRGPRIVALVGGVIYGLGVILASFATDPSKLWLLVVGYGLLGGFGLGMVYIVPIAMLQKWFPDKPGLITGIAVAGFGFGAVITAPVGQRLIDANPDVPTRAFLPLGIGYLIAVLLGASFFRNPPAGYSVGASPGVAPARGTGKARGAAYGGRPDGLGGPHRPDRPGRPGRQTKAGKGAASEARAAASGDYTQQEALRTPQWYLLTAILTLSVTAGISLIAVAAGSASDVAGYSAVGAASLVGLLGLFNGAGRVLWGWLSDKIGKMPAFVGILGIQGICLILIPHASSPALFAILAALIYTCYGGAFGTMPSTAGKFFGIKNSGAIYGLMLIGWSIGGIIGPLLIASLIGEDKAYTLGFTVVGLVALVGVVIPLITRKPTRAR